MCQNKHILTFVINLPTMAVGHFMGTINPLPISIAAESQWGSFVMLSILKRCYKDIVHDFFE